MDINDSDVESDETLWNLYECWMTHNEVSRSLDDKHKRFAAFKENVKYIHLENKGHNFPYKLKLNMYSDMTIEEFESKHTAQRFQHLDVEDSDVLSDETLWDLYERWMAHYEVSKSPEEKPKGFAAFKLQVKYIHLANKRDNIPYKLGLNRFSDLTRDEFVSKYTGDASPAKLISLYESIKKKGILSEDDYNQGKMDGPRVTLDGYGVVPPNDEEALQEEILKHPVGAFVDPRGGAFKNYRRGVLTEEFGKEPIHTVTITGFGVTPNGVKYWEIQNCWGGKWGEDGYMRIQRGVNLCGIASFVTFPIINVASVLAFSKRG